MTKITLELWAKTTAQARVIAGDMQLQAYIREYIITKTTLKVQPRQPRTKLSVPVRRRS